MNCRFVPAPPLSSFVRCFWYSEGVPCSRAGQAPHTRERLMPNGEASIVFNLRDEAMLLYDGDDPGRPVSCGRAGLTGPRTHCFLIDTAAEDRVVGIQFQPGGSFPFVRAPAGELGNRSVALEDLWGAAAGRVREQLLEACSVSAMFAGLEQALLGMLARPLALHPAIEFARRRICRARQVATVAGLIEQTGLSERRLIDLFRDQVGMTPKAFCRVRRFQRVLMAVHRQERVDWARVAQEGGYYDQAHLIHDFQSFAGMTPATYVERATEHLNHVPVV